jgi:hypothetical protein
MTEGPLVQREWTFDLEFEEAQVRCRLARQRRQIQEYTVQLELHRQGMRDCSIRQRAWLLSL